MSTQHHPLHMSVAGKDHNTNITRGTLTARYQRDLPIEVRLQDVRRHLDFLFPGNAKISPGCRHGGMGGDTNNGGRITIWQHGTDRYDIHLSRVGNYLVTAGQYRW